MCKQTFFAVMRSVLRLLSNVCANDKKEVAWDATVMAWEMLFVGTPPSFYYWRLVAYHRAVDIVRHRALSIEYKNRKVRVQADSTEDYLQEDEDGEHVGSDVEENLRGALVADGTEPPSCDWVWLREPGAVAEVLQDIRARFKRSEVTSFLEALNDFEFSCGTEEEKREANRHAQGMTRFRKRVVELLAGGELPRRTHQFLEEFLSRNKCAKRTGSGKRK